MNTCHFLRLFSPSSLHFPLPSSIYILYPFFISSSIPTCPLKIPKSLITAGPYKTTKPSQGALKSVGKILQTSETTCVLYKRLYLFFSFLSTLSSFIVDYIRSYLFSFFCNFHLFHTLSTELL